MIEAARQRAISDTARQRIGREGARVATKHVAWKLIKQKYERERALHAYFPGRKLAIGRRLVRSEEISI